MSFLLCSDGYWELIEEHEMESTLASSATPEEWIGTMNEIVNARGEGTDMDNYSAVVVRTKSKSLFGK